MEAALAGMMPDVTDRALLASLPRPVQSSLKESHREFVDPRWGFDTEFVGYYLTGDCERDDLQRAEGLASLALTPAPRSVIMGELVRMRAMTKARAETQQDLTLMAAAYAEEMLEYPPDVVRWACRKWARMETWWPSWAELKELLDRGVQRRQALFYAIRKTPR